MDPNHDTNRIDRVTEIYVAVFPVRIDGTHTTEVVLAGYRKDPLRPDRYQVRATVETHGPAVPELVELCDEIVADQEEIESYRLLKFNRDGLHVLMAADYRGFGRQVDEHAQWGVC